jgi:hypothetical protein
MPDEALTATAVFSTKMKLEKSTSFMRLRLTVLEPHSMSAAPLAIAANLSCVVTDTHSIPSCVLSRCAIERTTSLQRSIV